MDRRRDGGGPLLKRYFFESDGFVALSVFKTLIVAFLRQFMCLFT